MRRNLNYTGRKRLPASALKVRLSRWDATTLAFDADLEIPPDGLDGESRVFLEAYYRHSYMRFDYGTVQRPAQPVDRRLTQLESTERLQFRVKVVEPSARGRILAMLDGVTATLDDDDSAPDRKPILPVNFRSDMDELVWRVAIDETGPSLEVNAECDGIREFVRTDRLFFSLVFPAVVGEVVSEMIRDPEALAEPAGWRAEWVRFLTDVTRVELPTGLEDELLQDWRDSVMLEFARQHRAASRMTEEIRRRLDDAN